MLVLFSLQMAAIPLLEPLRVQQDKVSPRLQKPRLHLS